MRLPSAETGIGRLLRAPLGWIPSGAEVPILATAAFGRKWIVGSGPHSCWLGFNEYRKRRTFSEAVKPGDVVWDVGANVGSYTILASVLVGPNGHVAAFEPLPTNVAFLRRHVEINDLSNVSVHEAAIFDRSGVVRFRVEPDRVLGRVDREGGTLDVRALTLDDVVMSGIAPPPDAIKIDVEGGEVEVLEGGSRVLSEQRPDLFLSIHGGREGRRSVELLNDLGYDVHPIAGDEREVVARHPNPPSERLRTPCSEETP